ncbi:MAG: TolC family protein, partial [Mucilaginibacter sp.]
MLRKMRHWLVCVVIFIPFTAYNQSQQDSSKILTLQQCISYAIANQPALKQSVIDQAIAKTNNQIALSSWLPQLGLNGSLEHYNQLPYAFIPNTSTG